MRGETILLVEDDNSLRTVMRMFLEQGGYHVLEADNGWDAIYYGQEYTGAIQLLLTDVDMSPMSGPELAEHLLLRRPDMRVLFISGQSNEGALKERMLVLHAEFLGKPFNPRGLATAVRQVLDIVH